MKLDEISLVDTDVTNWEPRRAEVKQVKLDYNSTFAKDRIEWSIVNGRRSS